MKLYSKLFCMALLSAGLLCPSCVGDLDVTPIDPSTNTVDKALTSQADFEAFLAQCYTGLATSGSYGPNGDSNISGLDGGQSQYFRGMFHLNEYTTDECVVGWNDQTIQDLHGLSWTASDTFIAALYYRIFYQISMYNEFIRQARATSLEFAEKEVYIAEARALRALSYYHAIDMFGSVPFADETAAVGSQNPPRIERAELFTWLETELKDIIDNSALPQARTNEYGRINKGGARMILAKLYLNAEVYTGTARYEECAQVCRQLVNDGYSLARQVCRAVHGRQPALHGRGDFCRGTGRYQHAELRGDQLPDFRFVRGQDGPGFHGYFFGLGRYPHYAGVL